LVRDRLRAVDADTAHPRPTPMGDADMAHRRPTSGGRRSHGSLEGHLGQETQSRLIRGQPRVGNAVTAHLRLTPGGRRSHGLHKGFLGREMQSSVAMASSGGRRSHASHASPEAIHRRETHSCLARGHPRAGDIVMARLRPCSGERHSHDSPEANLGRERQSRLA
jgi:hypothetical protein